MGEKGGLPACAHYPPPTRRASLVVPFDTMLPTSCRRCCSVAYGKIEVVAEGVCEVDLFVQDPEGARIADE